MITTRGCACPSAGRAFGRTGADFTKPRRKRCEVNIATEGVNSNIHETGVDGHTVAGITTEAVNGDIVRHCAG